MTVTMTNAEAENRLASLRELEHMSSAIPAVVGYRIIQNIHALENAISPYRVARESIIKKYSKDGKSVIREDDPAAFEACTQEINDIASLELEVSIHTFSLKLIETREFPMKIMFAMDFMIDKTN